MILDDIAREKALIEKEVELSQPGSFDQIIINSLKQKLNNQVTRCKMLHEALAQQKGQFQTILKGKFIYRKTKQLLGGILRVINSFIFLFAGIKKQHQSQILELEGLVACNQGMLRNQTLKFKEQVDKLVVSDTIIEQLIVDNDQLTSRLINMTVNVKEKDTQVTSE